MANISCKWYSGDKYIPVWKLLLYEALSVAYETFCDITILSHSQDTFITILKIWKFIINLRAQIFQINIKLCSNVLFRLFSTQCNEWYCPPSTECDDFLFNLSYSTKIYISNALWFKSNLYVYPTPYFYHYYHIQNGILMFSVFQNDIVLHKYCVPILRCFIENK